MYDCVFSIHLKWGILPPISQLSLLSGLRTQTCCVFLPLPSPFPIFLQPTRVNFHLNDILDYFVFGVYKAIVSATHSANAPFITRYNSRS